MTDSPPAAGRCPAKYAGHGVQCVKAAGHTGQHKAPDKVTIWGGRYSRAQLNGTPNVVRDARRDQSARRRKPPAERCRICCEVAELFNGICADRPACEARMPTLL